MPYRDALIGDGAPEEDPVTLRGQGQDTAPGQRFISVEYSADVNQEQSRGRTSDQAVAIQFRRETENWGEWFLDAAGMRATEAQDVSRIGGRSGGRATLYNSAVPLTERWIANTAFGVIRTPLNPLVSNSFRFTLPSPLYAGVSAQIADDSRDFRVAAGDIGVLRGLSGSAFDATSGRFVSVGANQRLDNRWTLGLQSIVVKDVQPLPDHSSIAAAIHHELPGLLSKWSLHLLADSKGQHGAWADADLSWGQSRHRVGVYQLDPDLLWADAQLANDQRGFYWRVDQRGLRQSLFGGVNYSESNIKNIASRGGQKSADGFIGITLRVSRDLSLGGTASVQAVEPRRSEGGRRNAAAGSTFVSYVNPFGVSRVDAARYLVRPQLSASEFVDNVGFSHDWPLLKGYAITSSINGSREVGVSDTIRRQSLNLALRSPQASDVHWDAALALARVANARGTEKNVNASVSAYWQISPNWQASSQLVWNTIDPAPPLPGAVLESFKREKRLIFTLRYEQASGTPFAAFGLARAGQTGTGRISGVVFFDENGDGIRQANERGAANLTVFLDGRIPTTTDAMGRYQFTSVPVGTHTVVLLADSLPLPWTMEDEKGFKASVPLRGKVIQDIPLVRLRP